MMVFSLHAKLMLQVAQSKIWHLVLFSKHQTNINLRAKKNLQTMDEDHNVCLM